MYCTDNHIIGTRLSLMTTCKCHTFQCPSPGGRHYKLSWWVRSNMQHHSVPVVRPQKNVGPLQT